MRTPSVEASYPDTVERQVLTTLEALLAEIGEHPGEEAVRPEHVLDRDLGIGSLERVELLLRLEQQFGVRLPDAVMAAEFTEVAGEVTPTQKIKRRIVAERYRDVLATLFQEVLSK